MPEFAHEDVHDLRQLADEFREAITEWQDSGEESETGERDDYLGGVVDEWVKITEEILSTVAGTPAGGWPKDPEKLADELENYGDSYEPTLIASYYFTEYTQEFAEDVGYVQRDVQWPYTHIDWDAAAEDLKQDYVEVTLDGRDYYIRSS